MKTCTRCGGYKPDRMFYTNGPGRRMSECAACNIQRKREAHVPRPRLNLHLGRDSAGRFARCEHTHLIRHRNAMAQQLIASTQPRNP